MAPTGLKFTVGSTWKMDLDTFRKDQQKVPTSTFGGKNDFPNFCDQQKRSPANGWMKKNKECQLGSQQKGGDGEKTSWGWSQE